MITLWLMNEPENLTLRLLREMRAEQERLATHAAGRISCGFRSSTSALPRFGSAPENHNQFNAFNILSEDTYGAGFAVLSELCKKALTAQR